jgi:putative Mn2+ efflux pump MntP
VDTLTVLGIALGLAMDAFAVSIATGLVVAPVTARHTFRIAFHFGLFQFLMPVGGWLAGRQVAEYVAAFDHWVALALLGFIGGKMLYEAWGSSEDDDRPKLDPTRGWSLVTLSVATSLDALAVGFSMAMLDVSVWGPAIVIGVVACGLSAGGIVFGGRLGRRWGHWAETAGGVALILIGLKIVVEHLQLV